MGTNRVQLYQLVSLGLFLTLGIGCDKANFSQKAPSAETAPVEPAADSTPVAEVNTPSNDDAKPSSTDVLNSGSAVPKTQAGGIAGGHFDLDTSVSTYAFNQGTTVEHVHQYDDKYNVTGVDFFKLLDPKFVQPQEAMTPDQNFKIIVANAQLSPGARISINGQTFLASEWQKRTQSGELPIYSFSGAAGTQKLTALTVTFDPMKPISGQLIPTVTNLVRSNAPGPGQTYRAGALTVQMIDAKAGQIDATLGVAKIGLPGMLWESTLFWHFEK